MKRENIKRLISVLKSVTECLEEAYEATYNETAQCFTEEVNRRRRDNKEEFIQRAKEFIKAKYKEETGNDMTEAIADGFANNFFEIAMYRGDIDDLNRLRKE